MKLRRITSLTLGLSFSITVITSVVLYILPPGRVSYWSDWHLWGLDKNQWDDLHVTFGLLMLLSGFVHLVLNWGPITNYLKNKARQIRPTGPNFLVSLALVLLVGLGTYFRLPPVSLVLDLGEWFKDRGSELSPVAVFLRRAELDPAATRERLAARGIVLDDPNLTVLQVAERAGLTPSELHALMMPEAPADPGPREMPDSPPPGFGRASLRTISEDYGLPLEDVREAMRRVGAGDDPELSLKEHAERSGKSPQVLYEALRSLHPQ
jgi:hypothetical protein